MTEQGQQRETTMQMPGKAHRDPKCGCGECVGYLTAWKTVCSPLMLELATLRSTDCRRDSVYIADLPIDAQEEVRCVVAQLCIEHEARIARHSPQLKVEQTKDSDAIRTADLSPDAQEVLRRVVAKFRTGAAEHGLLNVTSRRWGPELLNEAIDMLHYCIFELMRLERTDEAEAETQANGKSDRQIRLQAASDDDDCTCIRDYLRNGGILRRGAVIPLCADCLRRDGLPLGGEWDNPETGGGTDK